MSLPGSPARLDDVIIPRPNRLPPAVHRGAGTRGGVTSGSCSAPVAGLTTSSPRARSPRAYPGPPCFFLRVARAAPSPPVAQADPVPAVSPGRPAVSPGRPARPRNQRQPRSVKSREIFIKRLIYIQAPPRPRPPRPGGVAWATRGASGAPGTGNVRVSCFQCFLKFIKYGSDRFRPVYSGSVRFKFTPGLFGSIQFSPVPSLSVHVPARSGQIQFNPVPSGSFCFNPIRKTVFNPVLSASIRLNPVRSGPL